ncbi:MAG TPA: type II toxin-antitoxin system VapB family antitoxin [Candidatus Sulfotelmatobacter sp.]|nr:type II toxin-antitoxin system VapB family antitoxin [Candidatus Sulfotelmatobacter sp.]
MRISIDIDDRLLQEAMRVSGTRTKKAVIEAGLRLLVETDGQTAIRRLRGRVRWKGYLAERGGPADQ